MGSKKQRSASKTANKSAQIPKKSVKGKKKKNEDESFIGILPKLLALLAAAIALYYARSRYKKEGMLVHQSEQELNSEQIQPLQTRLKYDLDGMVIGRPLPDVNLMPATASEKNLHEIHNPEEFKYVKYLPGPPMQERRERAMGARFKNFYNFKIAKYWDDGTSEGVYSGTVQANGNTATNTYTTHSFIFKKAETGEFLERITMTEDRHLYFIGPAADDHKTLNSKAYLDALAELEHMKEYHNEHGTPWLSNYPRGPPELFLYPADFVGQKHHIRSYIGYHESQTTQSSKPVDFNITVLSTSPRVLLVENLLNDYEIDHIINMGEKVVSRSRVGSATDGFTSKTRTSENGWLKRSQSKLLNTVYYRFADVLRLSDKQLRDDGTGSAENLQFVRYLESQRYDPHHDFGYTGKTEQRFSTLLIYLEIPEEGGGTSFPKAFNGQGIKVKPSKGDAVLFYSMLPDGNGDDMSLHSGMPVTKGRKYVCNLWSWDPHM